MIYTNLAALILRVSMGAMMLTHGWGKFLNLIGDDPSFGDPIGIGELPSLFLAVIGEFICPLLIILGLKTRLASIPPIITMFVAGFIVHADDPWGNKEKAMLYLAGFIVVFLLDSGKYSLDWKLKKV